MTDSVLPGPGECVWGEPYADDQPGTQARLGFRTPPGHSGAGLYHSLPVYTGERPAGGRPVWHWDGNRAAPTLSPSIRITMAYGDVMHGYIHAGRWEPCGDVAGDWGFDLLVLCYACPAHRRDAHAQGDGIMNGITIEVETDILAPDGTPARVAVEYGVGAQVMLPPGRAFTVRETTGAQTVGVVREIARVEPGDAVDLQSDGEPFLLASV